MRIALLDYRAGNLASVRKALATVGADVYSPALPTDLAAAGGLIVPGVGHFGATTALDEPWRVAIRARIEAGTPLLGICLGLQWLFDGSAEAPTLAGLELLAGRCTRLAGQADATDDDGPEARGLKVPHVGWNTVHLTRDSWLLEGVVDGAYAYFTHSYAAPVTDAAIATTTYGETFASAVLHDRVGAVQFHPEKSGNVGLRVLRNFLAAVERAGPGSA